MILRNVPTTMPELILEERYYRNLGPGWARDLVSPWLIARRKRLRYAWTDVKEPMLKNKRFAYTLGK